MGMVVSDADAIKAPAINDNRAEAMHSTGRYERGGYLHSRFHLTTGLAMFDLGESR